jgi:D-beta-D-heptose 7-phosphate kinase/D-beta-D-heptose 1-phosphate adenosyltransferase
VGLEKLKSVDELRGLLEEHRAAGERVVFTNGCFDLLHPGHIRYLREAAALGDLLVVAINSDASVQRLKGPRRPLQPERERAEILCALETVRYVTLFGEDTPLEVITALRPQVLVKGGDWAIGQIVGRDVVEAGGGRVHSLPFAPGYSTTALIRKVLGGTD